MQAPAGRVYPVISVATSGVVVDAMGSSLTFPPAETDVLPRAETVKARLESVTAARAAMRPAASPSPAASSPTPAMPTNKIAARLEGKLVICNGRNLERFDTSNPKDKKYLAVYFSASWCGPCKEFTPRLVDWYKRQKAELDKFDVIFVSRDESKEDMLKYMKDDGMPWPALKFRKGESGKFPSGKICRERHSLPCDYRWRGQGPLP